VDGVRGFWMLSRSHESNTTTGAEVFLKRRPFIPETMYARIGISQRGDLEIKPVLVGRIPMGRTIVIRRSDLRDSFRTWRIFHLDVGFRKPISIHAHNPRVIENWLRNTADVNEGT